MLRCAITDRKLLPQISDHPVENAASALASLAAQWAAADIDYIQLREKDLPAGEQERIARAMMAAIRSAGRNTRLLVNGRIDVAIAAGADGVHLTSQPGELTVAEVRKLWPNAIVSVACHTVEDVIRARNANASFVLFAPVFEKPLRDAPPIAGIGLSRLAEACRTAETMPVLALGGVTLENAPDCTKNGASGIAGIRLFTKVR
jgi:thiamine-phosphate pyrophosphorylase